MATDMGKIGEMTFIRHAGWRSGTGRNMAVQIQLEMPGKA